METFKDYLRPLSNVEKIIMQNEMDGLKKKTMSELRDLMMMTRTVTNTRGLSKDDMIEKFMLFKHGKKRMQQAFGS